MNLLNLPRLRRLIHDSGYFPLKCLSCLIIEFIFLILRTLSKSGKVKDLRAFDIDIYQLGQGEHHYEFLVTNEFFDFHSFGPVEKGDCLAKVILTKSSTLIDLTIQIKGTVELECDRSLEIFDYPLDFERKILYKFGPESQELSDEIFVIPSNTPKINIAQAIYEFIGLAIPMKKLHPRFKEESYSEVDPMINNETPQDDPEQDPRWDVLKKLKK